MMKNRCEAPHEQCLFRNKLRWRKHIHTRQHIFLLLLAKVIKYA